MEGHIYWIKVKAFSKYKDLKLYVISYVLWYAAIAIYTFISTDRKVKENLWEINFFYLFRCVQSLLEEVLQHFEKWGEGYPEFDNYLVEAYAMLEKVRYKQ